MATLAVLVGATILLIVLDTTGSLDGVFSFFEDPISGVMGWTLTRTDAIVDTVTGPDDIQVARAQILALQSQVDSLQRENEQLREIEGVAGVHIMAIEWESAVKPIVEGAGLYPRPVVPEPTPEPA